MKLQCVQKAVSPAKSREVSRMLEIMQEKNKQHTAATGKSIVAIANQKREDKLMRC